MCVEREQTAHLEQRNRDFFSQTGLKCGSKARINDKDTSQVAGARVYTRSLSGRLWFQRRFRGSAQTLKLALAGDSAMSMKCKQLHFLSLGLGQFSNETIQLYFSATRPFKFQLRIIANAAYIELTPRDFIRQRLLPRNGRIDFGQILEQRLEPSTRRILCVWEMIENLVEDLEPRIWTAIWRRHQEMNLNLEFRISKQYNTTASDTKIKLYLI